MGVRDREKKSHSQGIATGTNQMGLLRENSGNHIFGVCRARRF